MIEAVMKQAELEISADELWKLHLKTGEILAVKLAAEKEVLESV